MPKKANRDEVYTRAIRFRIVPSKDQIACLQKVSDHLYEIWNHGLSESGAWYDTHIAPFTEALKAVPSSSKEAEILRAKIKDRWQQQKKEKENTGPHTPVDFNYRLAEWRKEFPEYTQFSTDWQRETLRSLAGALASWKALRAKGDPDAHRPRERSPEYFNEIICYGSGWKIDGGMLRISARAFGEVKMNFPLSESSYVQEFLEKSDKLVRCIINRYPAHLSEPGEWYVSLVADFPRPEAVPLQKAELVFIALGATALGVVSSYGEEEIILLRPDKQTMPGILELRKRLKGVQKNSRRWKKRYTAKRNEEQYMSRRQKQDHNEIVKRFLRPHGVHFVVTDLVVRSKERKLADSENPKRGGVLGANWSVQNTGSIAALTAQLQIKTEEWGGSVAKFTLSGPGKKLGKIEMAQFLRDQYLASLAQ